MRKIKVSLKFPATEVKQPVTYELIKDYNLKINILHADISLNKEGKLFLDISGEDKDIDKGIQYLKKLGVECKLFEKTIIWQEDGCIHCGACTAVCPTDALQMDGDTLVFDREKCVACGLCVPACPMQVISLGL